MASKNTIEPKIAIVISTSNLHLYLPIIVVDEYGVVLETRHTVNEFYNSHKMFTDIITKVQDLIEKYNVDTIILEKNNLFTNTISRYPDPFILNSVIISHKINTLIEYTFYDKVTYILQLSEQEWTDKVLGKSKRYAIDMYKSHIKYKINSKEQEQEYDKYNYYKTLCLSESIKYDSLMNTKNQINKEK